MQVLMRGVSLITLLLVAGQVMAAPPRIAPAPLAPEATSEQAEPVPLVSEENTNEENEVTETVPVAVGSAPVIEGAAENMAVFQLLEQLRQIQAEITELRALAEQQEHQMNLLTKRQRSLYQDMDRRLLELEAGGRSGASSGISNYKLPDDKMGGVSANAQNISQTTGSAGSGIGMPGAAASTQLSEKEAYTRAFNVLKEGNYSQAITVFREFLKNYPDGKYADNAQYWLGEAIYATRDYKTALAEFKKILTDYENSPKRKDAELKIGFTYYELRNWQAAREALESVVKNYPDTTNARTAKQRLERLAREGR